MTGPVNTAEIDGRAAAIIENESHSKAVGIMHKKPGCVSGGVNGVVSRIEAPSQPKIGTYSPSPGVEFGVTVGAKWVNRYGFETEFEKTIDGLDWNPRGFSTSYYFNTKFIWARDKYGFSGSRTNATNGQYSGVTFNTNDTSYGSTWGISSAGGGVVGNGSATNSWHIGSIGAGVNIIPDTEKPNHSFAVEIRPFWERIKYDSNGYSEVQNSGSIYNGINQQYGLDTTDNYFGTSFEARAYMTPHWCDYVVIDVGGRVDLAYHEGSGSFTQTTNMTGAQVNQSLSYSESGFTVGGGVSAGATIKVPERFRIGRAVIRAEIDYSVLPKVTSFNFRGAPNDAPGSFSQKSLDRVTGAVGLKISF